MNQEYTYTKEEKDVMDIFPPIKFLIDSGKKLDEYRELNEKFIDGMCEILKIDKKELSKEI